MDGPQDLGGKSNFGRVFPETDEPVFHADWEARVLGVTLAAGGLGHWNIDESRHARESLSPHKYYGLSYYELWYEALVALLLRHGELTEQELEEGRMLRPGLRPERCVSGAAMPSVLAAGGPSEREPATEARFEAGQVVRTIVAHPPGHTRLPNYARGKPGRILAVRGAHVLPDARAHGQGEQPQWLYTVSFDGRDLWGSDSEPGLSVSIDAWESYLETA